jgi:hypothetical protein
MAISGLYQTQDASKDEARTLELRLDVDGVYRQMVASGVVRGQKNAATWMSRLTPSARGRSWAGRITHKRGSRRLLPFSDVAISVIANHRPAQLRVEFHNNGHSSKVFIFRRHSFRFHSVDVEFDRTSDVKPTTEISLTRQSRKPINSKRRVLTVANVYEQAGFRVTKSPEGLVPISLSGGNSRWSEQELNDAMERRWSHFANQPQWALWVFTTGLFDDGRDSRDTGGVMFDYRGAVQRQGAAIFNESWISTPPAKHTDPDAWVQRTRFWATCHEMGHAFNLAHSWEKSRGTSWIPMRSDKEARSFMNYPFEVRGGEDAFFRNFEYRFSDSEILFLRHAPERLVQMGNSSWAKGHGIEKRKGSAASPFRLEVRANRNVPHFQYLEPVVLELKLTNVSGAEYEGDQSWLRSKDRLVILVTKEHSRARRFLPYVRYHSAPAKRMLPPAQSLYEALFISSGADGWYLSDPGRYYIQVILRLPSEDVISNELELTIDKPERVEEERFAQDFFSLDVGRVLNVDGSRVLNAANSTLARAVDEFGQRRVAVHAQVALGCAQTRPAKVLQINGPDDIAVVTEDAHWELGNARMRSALYERSLEAIETLGHIDYKLYVDWYTDCLLEAGLPREAQALQEQLLSAMSGRQVLGQEINTSVLESIKARAIEYSTLAANP